MPTTTATIQIATLVRQAITRVNRRLRQTRPAGDVTIAQISALQSLDARGGLTPTELAEAERVQPPTITRVVARLEERGLITRTPHPTDGRQVILSVSAQGRALLDDYHRVRDEWLARRLDRLSVDDRATLQRAAEILTRMAKEE